MYVPLIATEDGIPQFIKQPGVALEPGDILGIRTLDDPAHVKHAKPFDAFLFPLGPPTVRGEKPLQCLAFSLEALHNVLDGYDNQAVMQSTSKDPLAVLRDPDLPFSEINSVLSILSDHMPAKLEESIRSTTESFASRSLVFKSSLLHELRSSLRTT